jgi:hypothetical protein
MIQLMGENYYFDLDVINDYINIESKQVLTGDTDQHISVVKYEMVKMMMEIIVTEQEETDEMLGHKGSNNLTVPFKIAWNTLLKHKMIQSL